MSRSEDVYINDILESIEIISRYTENKTEFEFEKGFDVAGCRYTKV